MLKLPPGVSLHAFIDRLGKMVFTLPMVSSQMRHQSVVSTLKDYSHVDQSDYVGVVVIEFLKDLQVLSTSEIVEIVRCNR